MSEYGRGPYGGGPYGIGETYSAPVPNFRVTSSIPNVVNLTWENPSELAHGEEVVIMRTKTHYPMHLHDVRAELVYRSNIAYSNVLAPFFDIDEIFESSTTTVGDDWIEDTAKDFNLVVGRNHTIGNLEGCLIEDGAHKLFKVIRNSTSKLYLQPVPFNSTVKPTAGEYRFGRGLEDDQFYYYTAFVDLGPDSRCVYGIAGTSASTQFAGLSLKDRGFGDYLYGLLPMIYRTEDKTGDLKDLMEVIGANLNENLSLVSAYNLSDPHKVYEAVLPAQNNTLGYDFSEYGLGIDTFRRISSDIVGAWRLKGTKDGLAKFIRIITTWKIDNPREQIIDTIGGANFMQTASPIIYGSDIHIFDTVDGSGAKIFQRLPSTIPPTTGYRGYLIEVKGVAINLGVSTAVTPTTLTDDRAPFISNLKGNFIFPSDTEPSEFFEIFSNTEDTIFIVQPGNKKIMNLNPGQTYFVLSPLEKDRFLRLYKLLKYFGPIFSRGFITFVE